MKKLILFSLVLFLVGCESVMVLESATRQTIIPGTSSVEKFVNYKVEFRMKKEMELKIDSVIVSDEGKCYVSKYTILFNQSDVGDVIDHTGLFVLNVAIRKGQVSVKENCSSTENQLTVYYSQGGNQNKMVVSTFKEETVRKR